MTDDFRNSKRYVNSASYQNSGQAKTQAAVGEPRLWLDDGDIRLYHGDALETVRQLPDESVDCVVTSPPYWGLRDYGIDGQMGLEETPDLFVANMVELFREIRRVLAPHGSCWVNLGDSYNSRLDGSNGDFNTRPPGATNSWSGSLKGLHQKNLLGMPWRVAFGLQADGWILRSDIIWAKPNPMPESVTDRPTKAHEYIFLLTKQPRYWFDTEAVREPAEYGRRQWSDPEAVLAAATNGYDTRPDHGVRAKASVTGGDPSAGRNVRSVWQIATQPYPEAHFATFPEELARRCILAGCPTRVCRVCGKPSERIVDVEYEHLATRSATAKNRQPDVVRVPGDRGGIGAQATTSNKITTTVGWSECGCKAFPGETRGGVSDAPSPVMYPGKGRAGRSSAPPSRWRPGVVLDPFIGSGTTAKVARDHQRHAIGIDLNHEYLELAARRLQQLSLLT